MMVLALYRKHFLIIDAIACAVVWALLLGYRLAQGTHLLDLQLPQNGIPELVVTVGSTLLGFVLAGVTLLAAFQHQITYLKKRNQYDQVVRIFFQAIIFTGITLVAGAAAIVTPGTISDVTRWILGLAAMLAVVRVYRVVWVLYHLAKAA